MRDISSVRCAILAGTLALSLTGLTAAMEEAQAMPATSLSSLAGVGPTTVQYGYGYGYRRFPRRPHYGYRYRGRAGRYDCGPGALQTRLSRKACRG